MQGLVDNMHQQFIDDVASGRKRPVTEIQPLATGQVWTGQQALPLHLIDSIGSFQDALAATAKQVGISGEPQVVKPYIRRKSLIDILTSPSDLFPGRNSYWKRMLDSTSYGVSALEDRIQNQTAVPADRSIAAGIEGRLSVRQACREV